MLNLNEDFKDFMPTSGGSDLAAIHHNRANLTKLGIDPDGSDTALEAEYVYCEAHCKVHSTGWCTVRLSLKRPLNARTKDEALAEASALGLLG